MLEKVPDKILFIKKNEKSANRNWDKSLKAEKRFSEHFFFN